MPKYGLRAESTNFCQNIYKSTGNVHICELTLVSTTKYINTNLHTINIYIKYQRRAHI